MEKSEKNPVYNIQKKIQVDVLYTDYEHQSCQLIGGDNLKIKFDLLKLSSISPLVRNILASFGVPLFTLGSLDFILPDSSLEELKMLNHMMNSNDGSTIRLSMDNWTRLQSLLEILDSSLTNSDPSSSSSSTKNNSEDIITLDGDPGDDNENTIHDEMEFHSNLEAVGSVIKEELDSGDESLQLKHKDNRMVSILRNSRKGNSSSEMLKTNPGHVRSMFSSSPPVPSRPATSPVSRSLTSRRTGGITRLESPGDRVEKPHKYQVIPLSALSSQAKLIPTKKTEKFIVSKKTNAGSLVRSKAQVGPTSWETKKPGPLSRKNEKHPRTRSESQSDETEDISSLMKFFGPSTQPTPAPPKSDGSKAKTVVKRTRRCGKCANCEINKQIKR